MNFNHVCFVCYLIFFFFYSSTFIYDYFNICQSRAAPPTTVHFGVGNWKTGNVELLLYPDFIIYKK